MANPSHDKGNAELLPCPFCGGGARIESNRDWHRIYAAHDDECVFDADEHVLMYPAQPGHLIQIAEDWNRRATPPSPSAAPDELLDMLGRVHPYAMPMEDFERAEQRLQRAVDLQQPLPVPDQAAIVWRGDLMRLIDELQHKRSVFDDWKKLRAALASRPSEVDAVRLLREARAALETWKDVAPAVSLCADIDRVLDEQYRQGQRDAVAADRARRAADGGAQ